MNLPAESLERLRPWTREIGRRLRRYLWLKIAGVSAFMWVFFIGYFEVLRHPVRPVMEMPLTALDHLVAFQPHALAAYLTLWLYVGVAPGLLLRLRELVVYGLWAAALCLTGLACFYFWPTRVPPLAPDAMQHPWFALLRGVDAAGNACPSLHVAGATFTAVWIEHLLRQLDSPRAWRLANGAWFALITWSTIATRQHVVLDAVAGALLGGIFSLASLRWWPWPVAGLSDGGEAAIMASVRSPGATEGGRGPGRFPRGTTD